MFKSIYTSKAFVSSKLEKHQQQYKMIHYKLEVILQQKELLIQTQWISFCPLL